MELGESDQLVLIITLLGTDPVAVEQETQEEIEREQEMDLVEKVKTVRLEA